MKHLKTFEKRDNSTGMEDYVYNTQGLDKMTYDKIKSYLEDVSSTHQWEMEFYLTKRFPEETKKEIQEYKEEFKNNKSVEELYKIRFGKTYLKVMDEGGFLNLEIDLTDDDKKIIDDIKMEIEANKYNL